MKLDLFSTSALCVSLACFVPSGDSSAAELLIPDRNLRGIRALGLGVPAVSLTGVPQGETPLNNPAWTGFESKALQKSVLRGMIFPGLTLGANGTTRSLGRAYFGGRGSTQTAIENFLKAAQNEQTPYGFFEMAPSLTIMRFQWALFARTQVEGFVWQPSSDTNVQSSGVSNETASSRISTDILALTSIETQMSVNALVERGTAISFSTPYKNTGVTLGVTARPTWRSEFSGNVDLSDPLVAESAKNLRARFNETRGMPVDFGLNVRFPRFATKPSLGVKLDDVGDTYYRAANQLHQSFVQKSNLSAGIAGWLFQGKSASTQCTIAGHHLNDSRLLKVSTVGAGCEIHFRGQIEGDAVVDAPLILRFGGTKDGLSYGASWDMAFALLEVASTSVSVDGPLGSASRKDRRYFLRLSVDASQP